MKKGMIFRTIALIFLFSLLITFFAHITAYAENAAPDTHGVKHAYLYNIENNKVVFSKGSNTEQITPSSTVKIMSGLLAISRLTSRLEENIIINSDMLRGVEGYTVGFKVGDKVRIKDVLYGLVCGGGNDAAFILAHLCSGNVDKFVEEMNRKAEDLGLIGTVYKNPTGIDAHGMVTTVNDIALLSVKAINTPLFVEMASASEYKYTEKGKYEERTIANRNALISNYSAIGYKNKYVKGLNSGMTDMGGYCVSAYATDGSNSFLCIVLGGEILSNNKISSYTVANALINYGLENFRYKKIASKGDIIGSIPVELALPTNGNQAVKVDYALEKDIYAYTSEHIDYKKDLTYKIFLHNETLTAPVKENTVVGGVEIFYGDELLASSKLLTASSVNESKLLKVLNNMKAFILSRTTLCFLIILIALLSFYFIAIRKRSKRKMRITLRK